MCLVELASVGKKGWAVSPTLGIYFSYLGKAHHRGAAKVVRQSSGYKRKRKKPSWALGHST